MDIRTLFPDLYRVVQEAHAAAKIQNGHGFLDHVVPVAVQAYACGREFNVPVESAAAGLLHNTDRWLQHVYPETYPRRGEVPKKVVEDQVMEWLSYAFFPDNVQRRIANAVLNHEEKNMPDDDGIKVALQDADKIVNLRLDVVVRSGQFHPELPVIDPELGFNDARGQYNGRLTVIADLKDCLDWVNPTSQYCVRTVEGLAIAVNRADVLRRYLAILGGQLREDQVLS